KFVRVKPLGAAGFLLILALIIAGAVGPRFTKSPLEFDISNTFKSPSAESPFCTDDKGRDVLARTVSGMGVSLKVGIMAAGIGVTFGLVFGVVTAYLGGTVDTIGQRIVESFLAFPLLLLAMVLMTALGRTAENLAFALALVTWPGAARI